MQQAIGLLSAAEGNASEAALLRNETLPLQAATGLLVGSAVSGSLWALAGLLVWLLT